MGTAYVTYTMDPPSKATSISAANLPPIAVIYFAYVVFLVGRLW